MVGLDSVLPTPGEIVYVVPESFPYTPSSIAWGLAPFVAGVDAVWDVECIPVTASLSEPQESFSEHLQQVNRAQNTECTDINLEVLEWGREIVGGWGPSWAQWANGGLGGSVCSRTIYFDSRLRVWAART